MQDLRDQRGRNHQRAGGGKDDQTPTFQLTRKPQAVVVIPGTVNYFYNTTGRRLASALEELNCAVKVNTLRESDEGDWDLCLISNLSEVLHSCRSEAEAFELLRGLLQRCRSVAAVSLDAVQTPWFERTVNLAAYLGIGTVLDLGLCPQEPPEELRQRIHYRFVLDSPTKSEATRLDAALRNRTERPIPWAFVGHATPDRAAFVDFLVSEVASDGFVYIPPLEPITEKGSPHLNHDQFLRVLSSSKFHTWCSHHHFFYMEPERFRLPLLSGCVPLKVLLEGQNIPHEAPLRQALVTRHELKRAVIDGAYEDLFETLATEYASRRLAEELGEALVDQGLIERIPRIGSSVDQLGNVQRWSA